MIKILTILSPMIIVFSFHVVGGAFFYIYDVFPEIDNVLHFLGGVSTAMSVLLAQQWGDETHQIPAVRGWLRIVLGVALVALVAVLWELLEFALDRIIPGGRFQDGLFDTMLDLIMGLLGALVVFGIGAVRARSRRDLGGVK
ncbi:hypothetical protein HY624_01705 [Candidatus Uhrbacteria bacterium]|nr:hypothetical protein [Candidatus Uhrbacteria bacterium]